MLDQAKAAREAGKDLTPPEYALWSEHREKVHEVLGDQTHEIEGAGFAHQVMKGAHQLQVFAAPVMDDLRCCIKPEPFYDHLGGACFTVDVDPEKKRKPLICRLCLRPVRTLSLKHITRWNNCGTNQPEAIPVPMPAPSIPGAEAMPGMQGSSGAPMPPLPIANQMPQSVMATQQPAQTPMPSLAAPQIPTMPAGNPAFPTAQASGGGIPCRIGLGDGMAQAGIIPSK